jgi:transketolase
MSTEATVDTERLCIDTIRTLAMDGVQKANSGHPGLPMAMAPAAYLLYTKFMRHDPTDHEWPDRDRFILSAGHGSMLLYAVLHLSGYDVTMDDLKSFRQWESKTPGHPERDKTNVTPGVEVTTGPLGQGFANGIGLAMAEEYQRNYFGAEVIDHRTFAIVSDGDLQEGISHEAASLAGHLKLGRVVYLYDDNDIQLDGPTADAFSEDVPKRFESYGWHTLRVDDVNDLDALSSAIEAGIEESSRPTLISVKSIIGWPAPNKQNTHTAHGSPLGDEEIALTKEILGWDPGKTFYVPDGVYEAFDQKARGGEARQAWKDRFDAWHASHEKLAAEWDAAWSSPPRALPGLAEAMPRFDGGDPVATRKAGGNVMAAFEALTPTMIGGAADLEGSTNTKFPESRVYTAHDPGRNIKFGVREHGMGGIVNGMSAHGGMLRPYGSTFAQFSDYMRGSIRLSALTGLDVAWVFTHDSIGLGEDGPTHQPVEHYAALRAIPGLYVFRPADANEVSAAWRTVLEDIEGPAAFLLSRQNLPILDQASAEGVAKGGYVLEEADGGDAAIVLVATGSEVSLALQAREKLQGEGTPTRVVSLPCWELFAEQDAAYRESVLPAGTKKLSVEAGVELGWAKWVDASVSLERFGASAPASELFEHLGFTPDNVAAKAKELLG